MNNALNITFPLSAIIIFSVAIGLGIFLARKYKLGWRLYFIGAALFVISQILHIPFNLILNQLFRGGVLPLPPEQYQIVFSAVIAGLSAALFEEIIRYAGLRWWAKDARRWSQGLLFGSGWGGIEALFVGIIILLNFVIFAALRTQDLSALIPPEQLAPIQETSTLYWSIPWYDSMLGALERVLVLPIQIALTIIVLQVFVRGQSRWLWFAIVWHWLLDFIAVYGVNTWGAYVVEALIAMITLASLGIIYALRQEEPHQPAISDDQSPMRQIEQQPIEITSDNVEDTRYTD
jgi:uncharacterized membrane protein YhfC